ncbi:right-handed parallel beta-helix repeat-containing protein [Dyadobacter endophyticus]|uniref:right-handed parallel beta-helix repeat-containing protein n=1 Tax=Dyadobacter endophyticus TaxID=1749036 RepID=UPI003CF35917
MTKTSTGFFASKLLAFSMLFASLMTDAYANIFNVTQTSDGNATSQLRGAILAANALGGGPHTINVPAGTYNLTLGTIEFGTQPVNISIVGAGAGLTVINMTNTLRDRIFLINPPGTVPDVTVSIAGIKFTNGKDSDDNYGGGAILCGGPNNVISITNSAFEGNVAQATGGGAVAVGGGGTFTVDNCTFTNNQAASLVDNSSGGAIQIAYLNGSIQVTGSATITNSTFTGNSVTSTLFTSGGAIGLRIIQSVSSPSFYTKIEKNKFVNNNTGAVASSEGGAISVISDFAVDINYNAFSGNTLGGTVKEALSIRKSVDGAINATNNWWGCNTDPQAAGTCSEGARVIGELGTGTLTTIPFLVLKPTVSNAALCLPSTGQATVTASFLNNSAGTAMSLSNLSQVIGLPVSFSAENGSISGAQSAIQADGKATATYTATGFGPGSVNVMAGYLTSSDPAARVALATGVSPTISTHPAKVTTCTSASSAVFTVTGDNPATLSYQWYLGNTPLSNDGKYSGVNTASLTVNNIGAGDNGGQFKVKISNSCGDAFSNSALLTVVANRLYVAEGASGGGSGWEDALGDLSTALNAAYGCTGITEIWVKAGTYKPSGFPYNASLTGSRNNAFYLINNVSIYGGFAGNEATLGQRDAGANQTILSGDIGVPSNASDNTYHTLVSVLNNNTARLDGFIVRDGNSNGAGIEQSILGANVIAFGGGGLVLYSASPVVANCVFTGNAGADGAGIYVFGSSANPLITNCIITGNSAGSAGGGIFNGYDSGATIQNCTIAGNSGVVQGAGMHNYLLAHPIVSNTLIWGNSGPAPAGIYDNSATPNVLFSLVQDGHAGTSILNQDPFFANQPAPAGADGKWMTADDGLKPLPCSPAINKGVNVFVTAPSDIIRQVRIFDTMVDIGAFELQSYRDGTSLSQDGDVATNNVIGGTTSGFLATGCRVLAQVTPMGVAPVIGSVQAKTFVEGGIISGGAVNFVQRHYEILPAANAENATARIKLFFLQSEFDAFNAGAGAAKLPAFFSDGTGKANLLVVQYHGTSATGQPGSYSGDTTTINPDDNDIVWNGDLNRWEVSFDVTGFSGFFISNADPLPLKLVSFTAKAVEKNTLLEWLTAEEVNTSHFEIHRSADARHWQVLPEQPAAFGSGGHRYSARDVEPLAGLNYYRLKMTDIDGSFAYSQIVTAEHRNAFQMQVFPNPATTLLQMEMTAGSTVSGKVELLDTKGVAVMRNDLKNGKATLLVGNLPKGIYLLRVRSGAVVQTRKIAIE